MEKKEIQLYFNKVAGQRVKWKRRNSYYHRLLEKQYKLLIPVNSKVLEIGCGPGDLLASLKPAIGVGVDFSDRILEEARTKYPDLEFIAQDAETLELNDTYDYIILSDLVGSLWDVQNAFEMISRVCHSRTRLIISNYNFLWEPVLRFAEFTGLKLRQPLQNWLSSSDITKLLQLTGFEIIKTDRKILLPVYIPLVSGIFNNFLANLPLVGRLSLQTFFIARKTVMQDEDHDVSIVVPAKNEKGNIESAILKTPEFGRSQEFIFVEGGSSDGTYEEILRVKEKYPGKKIVVLKQSQRGKGNAVREGFDKATGSILMILDADLTTPPEDLVKFYNAIKFNTAEFINGCRLVYPMEKEAMRMLNLVANKLFGTLFSFLLGQKLKDTLCGTKVLCKKDYEMIIANRKYFGDFDPFGDFDLLFGAAKLNLKITEIFVRYKDRTYGTTQISRFRHGLLLIRMCLFAARKIKFL